MNIASTAFFTAAMALANEGAAYMPPLGSEAPPEVYGVHKRRNNQRKRRMQWRRQQRFPKR